MKISRYSISFFLFLVITNIFSNNLKDAFEALSIHDYFKAKKLFYALNKKQYNSHASYGLAVIYYRNNNPFHNYDSACKYAAISYNSLRQIKDTSLFSSFKVDSINVKSIIDSIASKQLKNCVLNNSIKVYDDYLKHNYLASSKYIITAINNRDELEYNRVIEVNKSDSTQLFILSHPLSNLRNEAFKLKERQLFEEITKDKSERNYIFFITQQSQNTNINLAYRTLLDLYKETKNKDGIAAFIKNYPLAPQRVEAWQSLFTLSVKTFKKDELESFLNTYPDFPFKNSILKEVQLNDLVLIPVQKNDEIGFADTSGKIIIEPIYDEVTEFKEGLSIVHKNDSVFFINKENSNTLGRIFSDALPFCNGLAPIKLNNKWYLINRLGESKTESFEETNELSEDLYVVKQNNLYGAIDCYGQIIYPIKFDKLGDFKNGCAYYQLDGLFGFITKSGYTHKPEFEWISDFGENGLAIYKNKNKFGLIKNNGQFLTPANYDQIVKANELIYLMIINDQYGFYSSDGCFLSELNYDYEKEKSPSYYTNGNNLKLIKKNNQALIDLNGHVNIDFGTYSEVNFAVNNLIRIKKNNKYGFLDRKLNTVIPCKYITAEDFKDSTTIVSGKKGYQLINTKGEELLSSETNIEHVDKNHFMTEKEGSNNLYSKKGILLFTNVVSFEIYKSHLILYLHNNQIKIIPI